MRIVILLLLLFALACQYSSMTHEQRIQAIVNADDRYCLSLNFAVDEQDPLKTELYWRCRKMLLEKGFNQNAKAPNDIKNNVIIVDLLQDVKRNFILAYEKANNYRNKDVGQNDHQKCLNLGYVFDTLDKTKVEDYLFCRKRLLLNDQSTPPYRNTKYFKRPAETNNLAFVINDALDEEIEKFRQAKINYPVCIKFNLKTEKFKNCTLDYDERAKCLSEIDRAKFTKELSYRRICQVKAYVDFPNGMLKGFNERQEEIERTKKAADLYNKNNFFSIGVDKNRLVPQAPKKKQTKEEKEKAINSSDSLYTKVELTQLRQRFIKSCTASFEPDVKAYVQSLNDKCEAIVTPWEEAKGE